MPTPGPEFLVKTGTLCQILQTVDAQRTVASVRAVRGLRCFGVVRVEQCRFDPAVLECALTALGHHDQPVADK